MTRQVLDNAMLWIGDGRAFPGFVMIQGQLIEAVGAGRYRGELPAIDLGGAALSPGMVDLMVLGAFDRSILRDDPMEILREYVRLGVTSCQVCNGTLPWDALVQVGQNVRRCQGQRRPDAAAMLGLYPEGPFQQPELTGASLRDFALPCSTANVKRMLDDLGEAITMVNVAPGLEGDVEAVAALREAGKVVSMAHSNAEAARVLACVDAGTSVLGHVWDNNAGRLGDSGVQQPTLEQVALTDERVRAIHLICDGTHVHPIMVRMVLRCRGVEAICLVTDAVVRAGRPDGWYTWDDGRRFYKKDGVGRTAEHHLNGSALLLPDHLRRFVQFTGLPPQQAIRTVTLNPAASLGMEGKIGLLAPGRAADFCVWDDKLRVRRVWRLGCELADVWDYAEVAL